MPARSSDAGGARGVTAARIEWSGHERCLELWFDAEWRVTHAVIEDENG